MIEYVDFLNNPIGLALVAGLIIWFFTTLGAAVVFSPVPFSRQTLDVMLGFSGGVMIAASYWSLLAPALELSEHLGKWGCIPIGIGIFLGAGALRFLDYVLPHMHMVGGVVEGKKSNLSRSMLLFLAITLHNIPEGLAVGVAFGATSTTSLEGGFAGAVILMLGIGIQNVVEGIAVSIPLLRDGYSSRKAFLFGCLSGIVEPIAALLGALAVTVIHTLLPFALAFAAGAMIFVVIEEVIPETYVSGNGDRASIGFILGFVVMMIFDVMLGA